MDKITDMLHENADDNEGRKMLNARFLIRRLSERVHSGQAKVSDVREVRRKVNSLLKEVSASLYQVKR